MAAGPLSGQLLAVPGHSSVLPPATAPMLSFQEEANLLAQQIEAAHAVLNLIFSVPEPSTGSNQVAPIPTLATSLSNTRQAMSLLNDRLVQLQQILGQV